MDPDKLTDAELLASIAPQSDQLNADDLAAGPQIFRVRRVSMVAENGRDRYHIHLHGIESRPWRVCTTMARILVAAWGHPRDWPGRTVRLWRDPTVRYGGAEVGGIRINGLSAIDAAFDTLVTQTRGRRTPLHVAALADLDAAMAAAGVTADQVSTWLVSRGRPPLADLSESQREALAHVDLSAAKGP